ncbi:uncharacterized protein LOC113215960 [Frankliniella occidentalis]|uniref:Uncharacterized protein LOC113215960 n=1 Tax=Frankliniella occidentalis TaxID=133901 RepID=A0A6J1TDR1_FRAOC|nr:uncharacterized protein LOC113215960 [Frankliniella occidentalis]
MADYTIKRLKNELVEIKKSPLPYANAEPRDENLLLWDGVVLGPVGTPYEGGKFHFKMEFIYRDYPYEPPKVTFKTKIFHCNFNTIGNVCLSTLKLPEDKGTWRSAMGIQSILISIHQLMAEPNSKDSLTPSIGDLYDDKRDKHDEIARMWTERYAMED